LVEVEVKVEVENEVEVECFVVKNEQRTTSNE
jgi:hypothetical protein